MTEFIKAGSKDIERWISFAEVKLANANTDEKRARIEEKIADLKVQLQQALDRGE